MDDYVETQNYFTQRVYSIALRTSVYDMTFMEIYSFDSSFHNLNEEIHFCPHTFTYTHCRSTA